MTDAVAIVNVTPFDYVVVEMAALTASTAAKRLSARTSIMLRSRFDTGPMWKRATS
jgi:hypothetical protein